MKKFVKFEFSIYVEGYIGEITKCNVRVMNECIARFALLLRVQSLVIFQTVRQK